MTDAQFTSFVAAQRWIFAKTMPEIPHHYCLRREVRNDALFDAAVRYLRSAGYDGDWRGTVRRYLDHGDHVYWTMGAPVDETVLINRQLQSDSEVRRPA